MGVLSKLLGTRKAAREVRPRHEVIVHFLYGSTNLQHLYALEDLLRIAISDASAGEYDGREMANDCSDGKLYMYGPDAEALYRAICPVLAACPFRRGATVTLRLGPPKRKRPKPLIRSP